MLESPVVKLKYVSPRLIAENELSPTALVAGMTSNSFPRVEISPNSFLREIYTKGLHEGYQIINVKFLSVKPY